MLKSISKTTSIRWGALLAELLTLVFGVALGFWVNEWRADRARAETTDAVLRSIARELSQNRMQATQKTAYIKMIIAQIDSVAQATDLDEVRPNKLPGWSGAAPPFIRSGSYQAALATGAFEYIDFETANAIVNAYALQDYIEKINEATLNQFIGVQDAFTGRIIRYNFQVYSEFLPNLVEFYDRAGPYLQPYGYEALDIPPR